MRKTNLIELASSFPVAWESNAAWQMPSSIVKLLRMDDAEYPDEVHDYIEVIFVLNGVLNLKLCGRIVPISAGEVYVIPAGVAHAVAAGSYGSLVVIDTPTLQPASGGYPPGDGSV